MKKDEEGAALLSVLLIVALIAALSAASLDRLRLATRIAGNAAAIDQARAFAFAAETVALYRIGDLIQREPARTTLAGNWADRDASFPIDRGLATARLSDGGNCFNLNSLVDGTANTGFVARPAAIVQFTTLMTLLKVAPGDASHVAQSAADWIDSDTQPLQAGAEDDAYQRLQPAYRAANTLMADPSELRAVAGVTPAIYAALRPFVCALPVTELSAINVNTVAPRQAVLIAMLSPALDPDQVARLIGSRPEGGFASTDAFWNLPGLGGAPAEAKAQTRANTRWFNLALTVDLADAELEEHALIDAALKPAKLVRRAYGEPA